MRAVRYIDKTKVGANVVTAPGAAAVIASIAAADLPKGEYEVYVYAGVSGAAVADLGNMELHVGGAVYQDASPIPQGASGGIATSLFPRVSLDGAQAIEVKAIAAGGVGIEYQAMIVATKIETL